MALAASVFEAGPEAFARPPLYIVPREPKQPAAGLPAGAAEVRPLAAVIPEDDIARGKMERLARIAKAMGDAAVDGTVTYDPTPDGTPESKARYLSLMHAAQAAAAGDKRAEDNLRQNTQTHYIECLIKAGMGFTVELDIDANGNVSQYGQPIEAVWANSLAFASEGKIMKPRTKQEVYNGYLALGRLGRKLLDGQKVLVMSPYPEGMQPKEAEDLGFFPDTKSCALQTLTRRRNQLIQEVMFVAGAAGPDAPRRDFDALAGMMADLGAPVAAQTALGWLEMPVALDGSVELLDLVKLYDKHAGGLFFGQAVPAQDYKAHLERQRKLFADVGPIVSETVAALKEAAAGFRTPTDATKFLHDEAQRRMVNLAVRDVRIDARVFGPAVGHILEARERLAHGDVAGFERATEQAQRTAKTMSCPTKTQESQFGEETAGEQGKAGEGKCVEIKNGQSVRCPYCKRQVNAVVENGETIYCDNYKGNCPKLAPHLKPLAEAHAAAERARMKARLKLVSGFGSSPVRRAGGLALIA